jgi:hypothetical protein
MRSDNETCFFVVTGSIGKWIYVLSYYYVIQQFCVKQSLEFSLFCFSVSIIDYAVFVHLSDKNEEKRNLPRTFSKMNLTLKNIAAGDDVWFHQYDQFSVEK